MASRQVFYKSPGATWDFRVAINVGEATLSAPTAVILDGCGEPVAEGNANAPTATAPTIEGAQINVRVSGGANKTNWYLRVNANLSDGRKAEKYVPLVITYPIEPVADPIVVSMGGGEGITQAQLTAAIRAEAQARETADNALRTDIDANTARRVVGVAIAGRTITFTYPGAAETIQLPNGFKDVSVNGSTLTFTRYDDTTTEITLPSSGGGGGQTAQQVQDAIRTEIAKLDIPPRMVTLTMLFALVAGDDAPVAPTIPINRLQPAGQGLYCWECRCRAVDASRADEHSDRPIAMGGRCFDFRGQLNYGRQAGADLAEFVRPRPAGLYRPTAIGFNRHAFGGDLGARQGRRRTADCGLGYPRLYRPRFRVVGIVKRRDFGGRAIYADPP